MPCTRTSDRRFEQADRRLGLALRQVHVAKRRLQIGVVALLGLLVTLHGNGIVQALLGSAGAQSAYERFASAVSTTLESSSRRSSRPGTRAPRRKFTRASTQPHGGAPGALLDKLDTR